MPTTPGLKSKVSELSECRALMQWCAALGNQIPELKPPRIFHIPNGGKRSPKTGATLKSIGTFAGVADYLWLLPYASHHGIFIEMKTSNGEPTQNQINFMLAATEAKYLYILARGWISCARHMCQHLLNARAISQNTYEILVKEIS